METVKCAVTVGPYETISSVSIAAQHSNIACEKGSSYFVEDAAIVVKSGCAATFRVTMEKAVEKCAAAQESIQKNCAGAVQELKKCSPEIEKFCPPAALHAQRLPLKNEQTTTWVREDFWDFVPKQIPLWAMREWLPAESQKGLFAMQLSLCLQDHSESLSTECSETEMMKFLKAHTLQTLEDGARVAGHRAAKATLICGIISIGLIVLASVWFIAGCLYFWKQYKALKAQRGSTKPRTGRWSTSLFALDWRSLVPACIFPWFQSALTQAEVHDRDAHIADVALNLGTCQLVANTYFTRQALRDRRRLPLEPVRDLLAAAFCLPCAIAQHTRELDHPEDVSEPLPADDIESLHTFKVASDMM